MLMLRQTQSAEFYFKVDLNTFKYIYEDSFSL